MGGGIAMSLANIGIPVTVIDADPAALDRGLGRVRANYDEQRLARQAGAARDGRTSRIDPRIGGHRRRERCRHGHRSRVRRHGFEAAHLPPARCDREAGRDPRDQHLGARRRRHRCRDSAAAGRGRRAFLQPRACDEAAGGGARRQDRPRRDRHADGPGAPHGQGGGAVPYLSRLHRQCAVPQLHARGALPGRRRRAAARGGRSADSLRLCDGHLRGARLGRQRRGPPDAQGADRDAPDRPTLERPDHEARRPGPARTEERLRLVPL